MNSITISYFFDILQTLLLYPFMFILRNKVPILSCSSDDIVISLCLHKRRYSPKKNQNSFTIGFQQLFPICYGGYGLVQSVQWLGYALFLFSG